MDEQARNSCPAKCSYDRNQEIKYQAVREKKSLIKQKFARHSDNRTTYGTIDLAANNKRLMLKTPFGNMWYAHNTSQDDSFMIRKSVDNCQNLNNSGAYNERRLVSYLEGNIDFPPDMASDPVKLYVKHRFYFIISLILLIAINVMCSAVGIFNKQNEIAALTETKKFKQTQKFLDTFLQVIFSIDIFLYILLGITGFAAYHTNKSRLLSLHSTVSVASIIAVVFLSYIHEVFLGAFLARIIFYVYVRFVISLLHTILLMPPEAV